MSTFPTEQVYCLEDHVVKLHVMLSATMHTSEVELSMSHMTFQILGLCHTRQFHVATLSGRSLGEADDVGHGVIAMPIFRSSHAEMLRSAQI